MNTYSPTYSDDDDEMGDIVEAYAEQEASDRPSVTDNARAEADRRYIESPLAPENEALADAFIEGAEWAAGRAETTTTHECDSGDFDRTICDCGAMHSYCTSCGTRQDDCPHETTAATVEDAALTIRCDIFDDGTVELNEVVASNATPNRAAGLLATAHTRPTRDELAKVICESRWKVTAREWRYDRISSPQRKSWLETADAVLALLRGGDK